jgi:IS30 family transposase
MQAATTANDIAAPDIATALRTHALQPGARNVITTTHRRLIRQARSARLPIREIASHLGVAVTTVSKYSSDRAQARFDDYQRHRELSPEDREKRRVRAYKRWVDGRAKIEVTP